jgi:hypothetical protein
MEVFLWLVPTRLLGIIDTSNFKKGATNGTF